MTSPGKTFQDFTLRSNKNTLQDSMHPFPLVKTASLVEMRADCLYPLLLAFVYIVRAMEREPQQNCVKRVWSEELIMAHLHIRPEDDPQILGPLFRAEGVI